MKVLYVCAELFPFLKTGGLADVSAGLPPALRALGCDVRLLLPGFGALNQARQRRRAVARVPLGPTPWGPAPDLARLDLEWAHLSDLDAPLYLLQCPALYARAGNPYVGPDGQDWPDNASRFAALGWAAANLGVGLDPDWVPDVIHAHDWHGGLVSAYLRAYAEHARPTPASLITVHNLAYQGLFAATVFARLGLPQHMFDPGALEFYGQVSFLKAALVYSDRIATVSPSYAKEITTAAQGCGLEGVLRQRMGVLSGILNGVDDRVWSPATDGWLADHYDRENLQDKALAKRALQTRMGLGLGKCSVIFAVVSRLSTQKGLNLLVELLTDLIQSGAQLAVLGEGDASLERAFVAAARQYPGQVAVHIGYDEATAHALIAGADVMLLPSAYEPCGLTQLYGLRYGTLPLVRRVGGLADTVVDCSLENLDDDSATGFVFEDFSAQALWGAMRRAMLLFQRPDAWRRVQRRGMAQRFDWRSAAQHYLSLYQTLRPSAKVANRVGADQE